jgi:hypothetical protein
VFWNFPLLNPLQASSSLALLVGAYIIQQRCSPFVSVQSVSAALNLTETELAARLAKSGGGSAGPGTAPVPGVSAGPRRSTGLGADASSHKRARASSPESVPDGWQGGGVGGRVPATPPPALPTVAGETQQVSSGWNTRLALAPQLVAVKARRSLQTLALTFDYNHLVGVFDALGFD